MVAATNAGAMAKNGDADWSLRYGTDRFGANRGTSGATVAVHGESTCHDGQMAKRDRDESGRPRSARPRDTFGRPLPRGSKGVPPIPNDLQLPPAETLAYAQDLLDRGLAFSAHEVLEAAWKNSPDDERMLWQGLAQLAGGITRVP